MQAVTLTQKKLRRRKCRTCKASFAPRSSWHVCCSTDCAVLHMRTTQEAKRLKELRLEKAEGRKRLRTRSEWAAIAQREFNSYIRLRDQYYPCISCGRQNDVKHNAGHYLSVGSHPELRFDETNVHKQCEHCNSYRSGNAAAYRVGLIKRIGLAAVEALEGPHEPKRYTVDDLKAIAAEYRARARELRPGVWRQLSSGSFA